MIIQYFLFSYLLALVVVQFTYKFALKFNITDKPNYRKVHQNPKALLGGLAVFIVMAFMYAIYLNFQIDNDTLITWGLMFSIMLMGIFDDYFDMNPFVKFFFQLIIVGATIQHLGGISVINLFGQTFYLNEYVGKLVMLVWILGLVNAFNLIDGLDGLATGAGIVALSTLIISTIIIGDTSQIVLFLIMLGALFGFLHFNFYPSKIFLGDSGAMLIGYTIAIFSINEYKFVTLTSLSLIFLIAFLPLLDVLLSFIRRKINGKALFKADALHFHHRLLRKGYSHQQSVLLLYLFMIIYAVLGLIINFGPQNLMWLYILIVIVYTDFIIEKFYLLSDKYRIVGKIYHKLTRKDENV